MKKLLLSVGFAALAMSAAAQTVYFEEDFEWLAPWAEAGKNGNGSPKAGDTIGDNNEGAESPQISAAGMVVNDITAEKALLDKGYSFYRVTPSSDNASECIYLNRNYLKFGKTGYQAGICFPSIDVPAGKGTVLEFDWCIQRKGSGAFDPVTLYIIVENGEDVKEFDVPEAGFQTGDAFRWIPASIDLSSVTVDKNTKISIKQREWKKSTANRWFLDNIKLKDADNSAVLEISADENAPVEYYNLQGVRVANPESGLYIVKQGNKVSKRIIK